MDKMLNIGCGGHPLIKMFRAKDKDYTEEELNKNYVRDLKIVQMAKQMTH